MKRNSTPLRSTLSLIMAAGMLLLGCSSPSPSQRAPIATQANLTTTTAVQGRVPSGMTGHSSYTTLSASRPTRTKILFSRKAGPGYANLRSVLNQLTTGMRYSIADVGGAAPSPFICGGQAIDVPSANVSVQYEPSPPSDVMSVFSSPEAAQSEGEALLPGFQTTTVVSWSNTHVAIEYWNYGFQDPSWELSFTLFPNGDVLGVVDQLPYGMSESMGCYVSGATPTPGASTAPSASPTPSPSPMLSLDDTRSAFSPVNGPNSPNKDSLNPTDTLLITSPSQTAQWMLSVNGQQLKTGTGNLSWDWDGKMPGATNHLPDGTYTLQLTATGVSKSPTATVVIDTQKPVISTLKMAADPSDASGNSFIISGNVKDIGPAGLDPSATKVEIKGAAISGTENPFFVKSGAFSRKFTIQTEDSALVTADISAVDNAGNQILENSASDKARKLANARDRFDTTLLAMNDMVAGGCTTSAHGYHLSAYSISDGLKNAQVARDAAAYVAANDALYGTDPKLRAASFLWYATLTNIPLTEGEATELALGFGAGKLVFEGGILVFKAAKKLLPDVMDTLAGKTCYLDNVPARPLASNAPLLIPIIGRKLDYVFGKATRGKHNIDRSLQMLRQMQRIGLQDNEFTRAYIETLLSDVLNNPHSIRTIQKNGRAVREMLVSGPLGTLKAETVWEGNSLITVNLIGK